MSSLNLFKVWCSWKTQNQSLFLAIRDGSSLSQGHDGFVFRINCCSAVEPFVPPEVQPRPSGKYTHSHRGYNGFNDHSMVIAYISVIRCLSCSLGTTELLDSAASSGVNCQSDGELEVFLCSGMENDVSQLTLPLANCSDENQDMECHKVTLASGLVDCSIVSCITEFIVKKSGRK